MNKTKSVDILCETIRRIFQSGSEELKTTVSMTIQAWGELAMSELKERRLPSPADKSKQCPQRD